jgi:hypothetical protein
MKTSVIRRLESLEKEHRIFKQNEKSSLDDARICLWIIVLAYYVGDLKPEHDDPSNAHNRALKYPPNFCLDPESEDHRIDHFKRTYDAYLPIPGEAARRSGMMPPTDSGMISPTVPR